MREIIKLKRVSVRNDAEACATRLMRETWHLCYMGFIFRTLCWTIVNRGQGLEGRQTSKAFKLINFRCWKGTSRDISGASNSEITTA